MIDRRDMLIAGTCAAALGAAEWLRPRRRLILLTQPLKDIIPSRFGEWQIAEGGDVVTPRTPGSLASRLYNDSLGRVYRNESSGRSVMMLIAHGASQDDQLQLHRPESCYPAIGFAVSNRRLTAVPVNRQTQIPAVSLTATAGDRVEDILYWARLGDALPRGAGEQRDVRLSQAMAGYIADGVLVRASWLRDGSTTDIAGLAGFFAEMLEAMPAAARPGLIGTTLAHGIA